MSIVRYFRCACGAITIVTADNQEYSCKKVNLHKFFPQLDLRKIHRDRAVYYCNHCVNHYGLDLCGCGSGERFQHCSNQLPECNKPMQKINEYTCIKAHNAWG